MDGPDNLTLLTVRNSPVTIGELRAAVVGALPTLEAALRNVLAGNPTWDDAETLGADGLAIIAAVDPQAALFVSLAKLAFVLAPFLFATMRPDPDPIHDTQTAESRSGRRG